MTVNRKYLRIFLIALIIFGAYQLIDLLSLSGPSVPRTAVLGTSLLIATTIAIAGYLLYRTK